MSFMSDRDDESLVELQAVVIGESPQALLFEIGGEDVWVPKSLIHEMSAEDEYGFLSIEIPEWFAIQEDLI